eukprot:365793-Chlamydomonas_euryale.AAC.1
MAAFRVDLEQHCHSHISTPCLHPRPPHSQPPASHSPPRQSLAAAERRRAQRRSPRRRVLRAPARFGTNAPSASKMIIGKFKKRCDCKGRRGRRQTRGRAHAHATTFEKCGGPFCRR